MEAVPLSEDTLHRLRCRDRPLRMFSIWGEEVARPWSVWWRQLSRATRRQVHYVLMEAGLFGVVGRQELVDSLKELSGIAKKSGDLLFPGYWMDLVDLHLLRDYVPAKPVEEFLPAIREWSQGRIAHTVDGSETRFMALFVEGVREFLMSAPMHLEHYEPLTVSEWSRDPQNWARSGSSDGKRMHMRTDKGLRKARKTKWATAMSTSPDEVAHAVWSWERQVNKAVQKRELGKVRAVISSGDVLHLKMSYVSSFLERALYGTPLTTLFYSAEQQKELWEAMATDTLNLDVKMPVDQSEFDHKPTKEMILASVEEISRFCALYAPRRIRHDLVAVCARIGYALDGGGTWVGPNWVDYEKGVLSGWRWTALLDSIINYGELYVARMVTRDRIGFDPVRSAVVQGDDIRLVCSTYAGAVAIWEVFREAGFDVNPGKFFIATDRDEYLRQVGRPGICGGYSARAVPSLVYRNPVTRELIPGEARVREQVSSWNTVISRSGVLYLDAMVGDVARANRMEVKEVWELLSTPAAVGGLGVLEWGTEWRGFKQARIERRWKWVDVPEAARVLSGLYGGKVTEYMDTWFDNVEPPREALSVSEGAGTHRVRVMDVLRDTKPGLPVKCATSLIPRGDLPPSVIAVYRERAVREKDRAIVQWLCSDESVSWEERIWSHTSRRVYWSWVSGRLPFKTPIRCGWSPLYVSSVYSRMAQGAWEWVLGRHHASWSLVIRAALTAEYYCVRELANTPLRVAG